MDQALRVFRDADADLSPTDRELLRQLEILRSQVLKAESGHPFPLQVLARLSRVAEPGAAVSASGSGQPGEPVAAPTTRIRVLLADDYVSVRTILRAMLTADQGFDVIAEAANGKEAVELAGSCRPDIIIMDLNMPVLDGISATRQALCASPETGVIVFSANRDRASLQQAFEAGAVGYIFKPAARETLVAALQAVHSGKTAFQDDGGSGGVWRPVGLGKSDR